MIEEVEVRLNVGDFTRLGLGEAGFEGGDVGVHRGGEEVIEVGFPLVAVGLVRLIEEDAGV